MEGPAKCQCIMIILLSLTAIGLTVTLILIAFTQPEITQDAKHQVRNGNITNIHSESKNVSFITSAVQVLTIFLLVAILLAGKHYIYHCQHQANNEKCENLDNGLKDIKREEKK